ncbi:hypothetical protein Tco_1146443 [Tanacetum coccineum]
MCNVCWSVYNNRETIKDDLIVNGFMENYLPWSLMHNFETQRDNDQNEEVTTNIESDDIVGMIREELEIKNEMERKAALRSEKRKMKEKMKGNGKMNVKIFPPSFFDIMEHLPIHLAEEALLAGPVQYRWMYPIERYLLTLKMYVCNRACPEGYIAKGALMEECMTFCARRHMRSLQKLAPRERQRIHNKEFSSWFKSDVLKQDTKKVLTTEVIDMVMGLTNMAKRYNGYVVNGFRFRTKGMDNSRVTQNSGVVVIASTTSFSSRKDKNPMSRELTYYGKLTDIIEGEDGNSNIIVVVPQAQPYSSQQLDERRSIHEGEEIDSDEEMEDESEAHISDESKEEFDDTIDDTSDNDGVRNMRDDEFDDD